ncbi:MAG: hypothetical protein KAH18_06880 [Psychromonas sp.]|nr:hypothetical protein [Psychromonas sp.]
MPRILKQFADLTCHIEVAWVSTTCKYKLRVQWCISILKRHGNIKTKIRFMPH